MQKENPQQRLTGWYFRRFLIMVSRTASINSGLSIFLPVSLEKRPNKRQHVDYSECIESTSFESKRYLYACSNATKETTG
jgi:hypothetical protein